MAGSPIGRRYLTGRQVAAVHPVGSSVLRAPSHSPKRHDALPLLDLYVPALRNPECIKGIARQCEPSSCIDGPWPTER